MKKIIVIFALILVVTTLLAQTTDIETVMEIQAERELANWIEGMLYPIVGDNVAIVDMTLRYPSEKLKVFGSTLDTERSLPGLPVARSSGVMPSEIAGEETYPTIVMKKVVTIYLSKSTTEDMEEFVRQNVSSWVNITPEKGDKLDVKRVLNLKADEIADSGDTIIQTQDYRNYIIMIGAVLLFLMLIFLVIFSTRMNKLSKSLKEVNIPGLENALRPAASVSQAVARKQERSSKEPVTVRLLPQDEKKEEALSFQFIQNLSIQGCGLLLGNESPEAAAFVLSQLSPEFVSNFFDKFQGNTDIVLTAMVKGKQLHRPEIAKLHQKLSKNYHDLMEKESLSYDNKSLIAGLINNLPAKSSESFYRKVHTIDASFANLMRNDVVLLEDLANLETQQIENLIRSLDKNILINYLSIAPPLVKEKFFSNMTSRNREFFDDELNNLKPLDEDNIVIVQDQMLISVRNLLLMA
jgi:flagellar motor switch protein FliG